MRRGAKPAKAKAEAKPPVARKSLKNADSRVRDLEKRLAEALEQQTATAEILRVISSSPTDLQPVFDTIVRSAVRLCSGMIAGVSLVREGMLHHPANYGGSPEALAAIRGRYPRPLDMSSSAGVAILTRSVYEAPDVEDPSVLEFTREAGRILGSRSFISVPMLREGEAIGAISVTRREPGRFSDGETALLRTFADQAVIAIENVRLFNELEGRNRDLTATSEILRVISRTPTDVQPVFETIIRSAVMLCDGLYGSAVRFDGEMMHLAAGYNYTPEVRQALEEAFPMRPHPRMMAGRAILSRAVIQVEDALEDPEYAQDVARAGGFRSMLAVPMMREGNPIGAIVVNRDQPGSFSVSQIALLKTFADQAVIAIENVRLFTELQASNRELTTALDQQTATSDILRVISQSQTNVQPVFDAIVASAVRLLGADAGSLTRVAGDQIELAAFTSTDDTGDSALRAGFPLSLHSEGGNAQVIRDRAPLNIADAQTDSRMRETMRAAARVRGSRSRAVVPLLRHDEAVGTISVSRRDPGGFTDDEIALLKTFADQAVIAIENVRLFNELEGRNRDLTATSEILRVISSSPTDVQPVFDTIVRSAVMLCNGLFSSLYQFDGERIHQVAQHNYTPEALEELHRVFPARLSRALFTGRAILARAVVHIPDREVDPEHQHQSLARAIGWRSGLFVPMLREGVPMGVIEVARAEPGPFSDNEIELLKTFADQAVIAVENVRLFKELEVRNRDLTEALERQTATSDILQIISSSPTDVQPVFDAIIRSAVTLCDASFGGLHLCDGKQITLDAHSGLPEEELEVLRTVFPLPIRSNSLVGRALLERSSVQVEDVRAMPGYHSPAIQSLARYRTGLAVPMLREGVPIGGLMLWRSEVRPFTDRQIELIMTFANQAVIAIENVRLFKELQARTGELTQSVEKLTALGEVSRAVTSTLDVETVLDTIVSHASQLAGADGCSIFEYDEGAEQFQLRATHNDDAAFVAALRAVPLRKGEGLMGRAAEMREPIQIPDISQPGAYRSSVRDTLIRFGYRALLSVPLLREDQIIGSLSFNRKAPGEFPPEVVDVLKTFATQSALAIQNARLFREIADKSRQLEAASRHKSEFLANMSHELRTPLNAIIGFSEVLTERMFGELNEKQDEYLKDIYASGQHLLSLINDILDLSKIEAGRMELEATDFDLPSAIDNALILVRERATRRGIILGRTIDKRLGMLHGDERKVKQVLLNLLSNALKFTPEGGRIDVSARLQDGAAEIAVADAGVGIAPEDQEAVFEEFRQVGTADKKVEGTGLGLALSRKFIELHGGRIWVKSQVGHGSTFTFTLPVRREE